MACLSKLPLKRYFPFGLHFNVYSVSHASNSLVSNVYKDYNASVIFIQILEENQHIVISVMIAEGNQHIVVFKCFQSNLTQHPIVMNDKYDKLVELFDSLQANQILKFTKIETNSKEVSTITNSNQFRTDCNPTLHMVKADGSLRENIIIPWFDERYVSKIKSIEINDQNIISMLIAYLEPFRSGYRKSNKRLIDLLPCVTIETNLTMMPKKLFFSTNSNKETQTDEKPMILSIEIKVKCGLKSTTPMVTNERRLKYHLSKYQIQQYDKYCQKQEDPQFTCRWGEFITISQYDPLKLCSKNATDRIQAIQELFKNPQNNLKCCMNGEVWYGWGSSNSLETFQEMLQSSGYEYETLHEIITKIIQQEFSLWQALLNMQKLDVIESEGAKLIYDRLVGIIMKEDHIDDLFDIHDMIANEIIQPWTTIENQYIMLILGQDIKSDEIDIGSHMISKLIQLQKTDFWVNSALHMESQSQAYQLIDQLTRLECFTLLKFWMLSLIAKDASIIITLKEAMKPTMDLLDVSSHQTDTICGRISIQPIGQSFHYHVGLIDCELKSIEKFRKKNEEENEIFERIQKLFNDS